MKYRFFWMVPFLLLVSSSVDAQKGYFAADLDSNSPVSVLIKALSSSSVDRRQKAARILIPKKAEEARPALIQAMHDPEARVRWNAAQALRQWKDMKLLDVFLEAIWDESTPVRRITAKALGELEGPKAIAALNHLALDEEPSVRYHASVGLLKIADRCSIHTLIRIAKDDLVPMRRIAFLTLTRLKATEAMDIARITSKADDTWLRHLAIQAAVTFFKAEEKGISTNQKPETCYKLPARS